MTKTLGQTKPGVTSSEKMFTDVELELMTILWKLGEATVAGVIENLAPNRDLAYTSVSTILRILEQKGAVKNRKEGRGHVYIPVVDKASYEARSVRHLVSRVFDDAPTALVKQLINSIPLNKQQLAEIKKIINEAGGKK